ncbi:MAG TPA: helix-turn-helix transcriptional regulator [Micromonosporaceae bacterium]
MVLLRKVIGDALRARRQAQHRTLREVSTAANVSLGYLSEIERGHKEASSELLASICEALGARLSEMLSDVTTTFALAEQMEDALAGVGADSHDRGDAPEGTLVRRVPPVPVSSGPAGVANPRSDGAARQTKVRQDAKAWITTAVDGRVPAAVDGRAVDGRTAVTEGEVTVQVHSDGPLRTTLTATRVNTGQQRQPATVFVA